MHFIPAVFESSMLLQRALARQQQFTFAGCMGLYCYLWSAGNQAMGTKMETTLLWAKYVGTSIQKPLLLNCAIVSVLNPQPQI